VTSARRRRARPGGGERAARLRLAWALTRPHRHILLISHMRSYSSLLGHLLGSHPQVTGYVEQHQSYRSSDDLVGLTFGVWRTSGHRVSGDYLFDKLLHEKHVVADAVLHRDDVLPIYALREPLASMRSIVEMGRRKKRRQWQDPEGAARHVTRRYESLREMAGRRGAAAALFTDSIVLDTEPTLAALTTYLGLGSPLQPDYRTFEKTGVGGFGDPIGPIASGRIVAARPAYEIDIPDVLAGQVVEDYRHTADVLTKTCATVIGHPAP
jgi:hypothetical protein